MKLLKRLFRKKERHENLRCALVVVAAGSASRMEGEDKILYELDGVPVIVRSILPFEWSNLVHEIVIVSRREQIGHIGQLCKEYELGKVRKVVPGGASRTESVSLGLREVSESAALIAIHDGARPLVSRELLEAAIMRAETGSAAAPAIPLKDTVKRAKYSVVMETLPRENLFAVQTPQVFQSDLIRAAIGKALAAGVALTDDCSAVERLGFSVLLTEGSEENIKLTTPADLLLAEAILAGRERL